MKNKFHYITLFLFVVSAVSAMIPFGLTPAEPTNKTSNFLEQADPADTELMIQILERQTVDPDQCLKHYGTRIEENATATRLLGQLYSRTGDIENARKWLNRAITLKRDDENFKALAEFQLAIGEEEDWLKTMNARLQLPFECENYKNINMEIARFLIRSGRWREALPYATSGARSWNYKNLRQAAWLNASLGDIQRGLEFAEWDCKEYKTDFLLLYILTFEPELNDWTNELLDQAMAHPYLNFKSNNQARNVTIHLLRSQPEAAKECLSHPDELWTSPFFTIYCALICEKMGWIEQRDAILETSRLHFSNVKSSYSNRKEYSYFIDLYIDVNKATVITPAQFQKLQAFAKSSHRDSFNLDAHVLLGELLRLKGFEEEAKELFAAVVSVEPHEKVSEYIAYQGLRSMGEDPLKILDDQRKTLLSNHTTKKGESK